MLAIRLTVLFTAINIVAPAAGPLHVIRVTPESPADPLAEITVTFDRPVAGGLDTSVDPATVFRIDPAIEGRLEWRDPLTIRFTPVLPLAPGERYTISISTDFAAMDGSTLDAPFSRSFRVATPGVIATDPDDIRSVTGNLPARPTFHILLSGTVDMRALAAGSRIRLASECGAGSVALRAITQRRPGSTDPHHYRWAGRKAPYGDSISDLRRVVELTPTADLPLDCGGWLEVPAGIGSDSIITGWRFHTYGPLRAGAVACGAQDPQHCPNGPILVYFTTPVTGEDVLRTVRIVPARQYALRDTSGISTSWVLEASLDPRTSYAVVIQPDLADVFGQTLDGPGVIPVRTTGYGASVTYDYGRLLVERDGSGTLAVQHVNVDTLYVRTIVVPDTLESAFLSSRWNWSRPLEDLDSVATIRKVPVRHDLDERLVTNIALPASEPRPGRSLFAVQVGSRDMYRRGSASRPVALLQVTNLAVHARIATDRGMVWVTNVEDGQPRADVRVEMHDTRGRVIGTSVTDADGIAVIESLDRDQRDSCCTGFSGYVVATTADDRAMAGIGAYEPDLALWRFGVREEWGRSREPGTAAAFTDRGIYRPGETVYAKAIVRDGSLGSLYAPVGDSIRWTFQDRDGQTARDTTIALSEFGTSDASFQLPADAPLGWYRIAISTKLDGEWRVPASASYRVAEYRPPEFLVDATAPAGEILAGDSASFTISGRYLFGAPMAHSPVSWNLRIRPRNWGVPIPGADGFTVGGSRAWWDDNAGSGTHVAGAGLDTLDATGALDLEVGMPAVQDGRPGTAILVATVTDANRQTVSATATMTVHPALIYIGARTPGDQWFWTAGEPAAVDVIAIEHNGRRISDIDVTGTVLRRAWHSVRRVRNGQVEEIGSWVTDTVATCRVRTRQIPSSCSFTPPGGGSYQVEFIAHDDDDRVARTSINRWATGSDWAPWNDESKLRMEVIADRPVYDVGDTATVFFASPFADAEAWITVEREHVIESRRVRLTSGATTMKLPITEALAPNAFISIIVVRGRSADPGPLDDPGRPTMRVGYAELRVLSSVKRLKVDVTPLAAAADSLAGIDSVEPRPGPVEYGPRDTAVIRLRVTDSAGRGRRAEVTLWAVDEGVLALTGYTIPDPVGLIYRERGVGSRLASNLAGLAAQIPEGQKGRREAGGGGGADEAAAILRSNFRSTAFFLGSVVADDSGRVVARAALPDNLTTFRVMAVAVTAGDRYGSGQSTILVTRPLVARPALPRFVRPGDRFNAGVIVNSRAGDARDVEVDAVVDGIDVEGGRSRKERLAPGRGADVRFGFHAQRGDSARFTFDARSGPDRDAVRIAVPVRPDYHPLASTVAGVVPDRTTVDIALRDDVDPARSTLTIGFGSSVFAIIRGAQQELRAYPWYCSEQLSSVALPLIALYRARLQFGLEDEAGELADRLVDLIRTLARRQNPAGGIGYWNAGSWSNPTLSGYVGRIMLEARDAGIPVDSSVLAGIATYVHRTLTDESFTRSPLHWWYIQESRMLSERIAAAEFLSRYGTPDAALENTLLQQAARLSWTDRLVLAEMLERRGEHAAAQALLDHAWADVHFAGRRAVLPVEATGESHYFRSVARPAATLMSATLAVQPSRAGIGALVETLLDHGRPGNFRAWNTHDYGWVVLALTDFEKVRASGGPVHFMMRGETGTLLDVDIQTAGGIAVRDSTIPLSRLVTKDADGNNVLHVGIETQRPASDTTSATPLWFYLTVNEAPKTRPVDPVHRGLVVDRWYETIDTHRPTSGIAEGDLVRVNVRITVPEERHFVVLDDPLPAGLEPVDLSLRTITPLGAAFPAYRPDYDSRSDVDGWYYGWWNSGMWSPFEHREFRDDRVVFSATVLWPGRYTASYVARATTSGTFIVPPAYAEEMYNTGVNGRTGGTVFTVTKGSR